MTRQEIFFKTVFESAKAGDFDRSVLISQACDFTRELRDDGATPEATLISVKGVLGSALLSPPDNMREEIVTRCIETFFES